MSEMQKENTPIKSISFINGMNIEQMAQILSSLQKNEIQVRPPIVDQLDKNDAATDKEPVQAIYSLKDVQRVKEYFHNTPSRFKNTNLRNYMYFIVGLNFARRAGDLLMLRIHDFINADGSFKDYLIFAHEQKSGRKSIAIPVHFETKQAIKEYLDTLPCYKMSDYLFQNYKTGKPISVAGVRIALKRMAKAIGLKENIGTHSVRKTVAYHLSKDNPRHEEMISRYMNHKDVKTTRIYTGASQQEIDEMILKASFLSTNNDQ